MNFKILGTAIILIATSTFLKSEPAPLVVDNNQEKVKTKYIKAAHDVIQHSLPIEHVRFNILQAALSVKSAKWLLEEDNDDNMVFRWDYGRKVLYARVEYNKKYVQLKYVNRESDYQCINNINGICYKNDNSDFYGFLKKLRLAIKNTLDSDGEKQ